MKILCGTDFSEAAQRASEAAACLARRLGDSLRLLHVVCPPWPGAEASAELDRVAEGLRTRYGIAVEELVIDGEPREVLLHQALLAGARLIVVGRGERVAQWLIERTDRPLLVLSAEPSAFQAFCAGQRPLTIGVGVAPDAPIEPLLAVLRDLRAAGPCDVLFVQVVPPPVSESELGRLVRERLEQLVQTLPGQGELEVRLLGRMGSLADSLRLFARMHPLDVMVVGAHQRPGAAHVSRDLLSLEHAALLCVPLEERRSVQDIPALRSVLSPTDFSELADRAVRQAYAFLRGAGGHAFLCHVAPPRADRPAIEDRLRALVPATADLYDIRTSFLVLEGTEVGALIARAADELAVDAICMASRGLSASDPRRLGSVAADVLRLSRRPVFILRQ